MRLVSQGFAGNDVDYSISLWLVWGIKERDMSSCHFSDYKCLGKQVFDESFKPSTIAAQQSFVVMSMQQALAPVERAFSLSLFLSPCLSIALSLSVFPIPHSSFDDPIQLSGLCSVSLSHLSLSFRLCLYTSVSSLSLSSAPFPSFRPSF